MTERFIASLFCKPYRTNARAYIDDAHPSGQRHLVVHYDKGGYKGDPVYAAAIPEDWTEREVMDFIFWPMKSADAPYPPWEVPARAYGSVELFRWWAGEKAS